MLACQAFFWFALLLESASLARGFEIGDTSVKAIRVVGSDAELLLQPVRTLLAKQGTWAADAPDVWFESVELKHSDLEDVIVITRTRSRGKGVFDDVATNSTHSKLAMQTTSARSLQQLATAQSSNVGGQHEAEMCWVRLPLFSFAWFRGKHRSDFKLSFKSSMLLSLVWGLIWLTFHCLVPAPCKDISRTAYYRRLVRSTAYNVLAAVAGAWFLFADEEVSIRDPPQALLAPISGQQQIVFSMALGHWAVSCWEDYVGHRALAEGVDRVFAPFRTSRHPSIVGVMYCYAYACHHVATLGAYFYFIYTGRLALLGSLGLLFEGPVVLMNIREIVVDFFMDASSLDSTSSRFRRAHLPFWSALILLFIACRGLASILYLTSLVQWRSVIDELPYDAHFVYHHLALFFTVLNLMLLWVLFLWCRFDGKQQSAKQAHSPQHAEIRAAQLFPVSKPRKIERCVVEVDSASYDLTAFLDEHPGGRAPLLGFNGRDATKVFHDNHGPDAESRLLHFRVGSAPSSQPREADTPSRDERRYDFMDPFLTGKIPVDDNLFNTTLWVAAGGALLAISSLAGLGSQNGSCIQILVSMILASIFLTFVELPRNSFAVFNGIRRTLTCVRSHIRALLLVSLSLAVGFARGQNSMRFGCVLIAAAEDCLVFRHMPHYSQLAAVGLVLSGLWQLSDSSVCGDVAITAALLSVSAITWPRLLERSDAKGLGSVLAGMWALAILWMVSIFNSDEAHSKWSISWMPVIIGALGLAMVCKNTSELVAADQCSAIGCRAAAAGLLLPVLFWQHSSSSRIGNLGLFLYFSCSLVRLGHTARAGSGGSVIRILAILSDGARWGIAIHVWNALSYPLVILCSLILPYEYQFYRCWCPISDLGGRLQVGMAMILEGDSQSKPEHFVCNVGHMGDIFSSNDFPNTHRLTMQCLEELSEDSRGFGLVANVVAFWPEWRWSGYSWVIHKIRELNLSAWTSEEVAHTWYRNSAAHKEIMDLHRGGLNRLRSFGNLLASLGPKKPLRWQARCSCCFAAVNGYPEVRVCPRCNRKVLDMPLF